MRLLSAFAILAALSRAGAIAAQAPADTFPAPAVVPGAQIKVDATALRSARYNYDLALTRDGVPEPAGSQTITFSEATYAGAPAWLILESRLGGGLAALDSIVASRDQLAALHWGTSTGLARLAAEFTRDTVYGATSSPLGKRSLIGAAPRGVIPSEGMLDGLLQLAPIDGGWSSDATLLVADLTSTRLVAARLLVEREETVTVPAGTFESWVVSLRTDNAEKRFWVSKETQMVVKSTQPLPQLNGVVLDRVLTRVDDLGLIPPPAVPLPGDPAADASRRAASGPAGQAPRSN